MLGLISISHFPKTMLYAVLKFCSSFDSLFAWFLIFISHVALLVIETSPIVGLGTISIARVYDSSLSNSSDRSWKCSRVLHAYLLLASNVALKWYCLLLESSSRVSKLLFFRSRVDPFIVQFNFDGKAWFLPSFQNFFLGHLDPVSPLEVALSGVASSAMLFSMFDCMSSLGHWRSLVCLVVLWCPTISHSSLSCTFLPFLWLMLTLMLQLSSFCLLAQVCVCGHSSLNSFLAQIIVCTCDQLHGLQSFSYVEYRFLTKRLKTN